MKRKAQKQGVMRTDGMQQRKKKKIVSEIKIKFKDA